MAFKSRLLTTAAIPLIALAWMAPASAAPLVRADGSVEAQSLVIKVQSEEELQLQRRQERQERREQRRQQRNQEEGAQGEQQQDNSNRRKRQQQAEEEQQQIRQSAEEEQVRPRRKKNAEAEQEQQIQNVQQEEEPVRPRRKKQAQEEQTQQEMQQSGEEEQVRPRRKKNAEAEQEEKLQNPQQAGEEEPVKPRRKKNAQAQQEEQMQEQQAGEEETVRPRRKKDAQAQQDGQGVEEIETKPRRKQNAEADQAERPKRDKQKEAIANDPSKTAETIELPVENGAAVLDSDKEADRRGGDRERRKREREEAAPARVPKSDREAQAGFRERQERIRIQPVLREKGERVTGFKGYDYEGGRRVGRDKNDFRVIIDIGGRVVVRDDDRFRVGRHGETRYERLDNGRIREVVIRPNGDRIVTVRNRWGEIIRRSRIDNRDREIVIFYSPILERGRDRLYMYDAGADLPPMRLRVPLRDYIVDVSSEPDRDFEEFLEMPPVEPVERVYSVDEVKYSARIRDKVRRIDLDTITFETGSAEIDMEQANSMKRVGAAIKDILDRDPGETFLIEGHTDAVGSDEDNLVLSDERAESVANVLTDLFDIPAENLVTQGYGERFLKVETDEPERMNRRVTIRRITPLVRPMESAEGTGEDEQ